MSTLESRVFAFVKGSWLRALGTGALIFQAFGVYTDLGTLAILIIFSVS